MSYFVKQGTKGKLITAKPNEKATVINWTLRQSTEFSESLIDRNVILSKRNRSEQGYALFAGRNGGDRASVFILAIPYADVLVLSPVDPNP